MRPVLVSFLARRLGPWASWLVPNYLVMLGGACLLAALLLVENARRLGYRRTDTLAVVMVAYVGGIGGAYLVPLIQGISVWMTTGHLAFRSGMAAYGGLIGGTVIGALYLRRRRLPILPFLDATAPCMGLGYFVTRVGCFLAGCDYGKPTSLPIGVRFPAGSYAFRDHLERGWVEPGDRWSLPVHPTQFYSSLAGLLLFFLVSALPARGDGRRFLAYVVGYALLRSLIELLRGDEGRGAIGPLSTSQWLALASVIATTALVARARRSVVSSSAA
jgi:phosphatidylglycerol:prolipoprotein diacylglycerol transferase